MGSIHHDKELPNGDQKPEAASPEERPRAWFRYTVDQREHITDELLDRQHVSNFEADLISLQQGPVFDFVKTVRTRKPDPRDPAGYGRSPISHVPPSYHIQIHSAAVINALQSVVEYYPGYDLSADPFIVKWPYAILVHHYDELATFRKECAAKDPEDLCIREKDAHEHIGLVLEFLDNQVMEQVNLEKERNKRGYYSFEWYWVPYKPGVTSLQKYRDNRDWTPSVLHSVSGGVFESPPVAWRMTLWRMNFDGRYLGREIGSDDMDKFDGERDLSEETLFVNHEDLASNKIVAERVRIGEAYWQLLRKQCKHYQGPAAKFPYNQINSLVIADLISYYSYVPGSKPDLMDQSDCRKWTSDCECSACSKRGKDQKASLESRFENYNGIALEWKDSLDPHIYLLCPSQMPAYIFKTRTWDTLHVANFSKPQFNENLMDSLVMDASRVQTLKSLAKSFIRVSKNGEKMTKPPWGADFVRGKGSGLIFLLHGKPGVGKTCTAECIAEYIKRPLMTLSCSDIGTDPNVVEDNLIRNFKTARSWDAVLLIDEADVFMERRSTSDLQRNSLVAGFLRALEFYDGILFLTTNRVGSFDDAFMSRVHVQLYYADFTDEERQLVWKTFTEKLARERGDYIRLNIDAKEYIRGAEMRALQWNGREIRNAFQTAVALAEYEAIKDEEKKIVITDSHLRAVVQLSSDFKQYVNTLHRGDEGKRAERKYERLDSYDQKAKD